jgi:hypothetical protein
MHEDTRNTLSDTPSSKGSWFVTRLSLPISDGCSNRQTASFLLPLISRTVKLAKEIGNAQTYVASIITGGAKQYRY